MAAAPKRRRMRMRLQAVEGRHHRSRGEGLPPSALQNHLSFFPQKGPIYNGFLFFFNFFMDITLRIL